MAKAAQKEQEQEEEEYEVEKILDHERAGKLLRYFVSWVGYPDPKDDLWIDEGDAAGASEAIDVYWNSLPASQQAERDYKAATVKKTSSKRDASQAKLDDASAKSSKKKATPTAAATKEKPSPAKKDKKEKKDKAAKPAKEPKAAKVPKVAPVVPKAVSTLKSVVAQTDEDDAPASDDGSAAEYSDGEEFCEHELEPKYKKEASWEKLVRHISTVDQTVSLDLRFRVIWEEDGTYSYIGSGLGRERCPQKVIDFYESHLKFRPHADDIAEGAVADDA